MAIQRHTKVFTAFSFLRLRSPDIFWYQWIYPTCLFLVVSILYQVCVGHLLTIDVDKLIGAINPFMGVLFGFYNAALAAVSSFSNEHLDRKMKGRAPTLTTVRNGEKIKKTLTRRRFLAILYGYCAALTVVIFIFGVLQDHIIAPQPESILAQVVVDSATRIMWWFYCWIMSSLFVVTFLGLHYLIDRVHRE